MSRQPGCLLLFPLVFGCSGIQATGIWSGTCDTRNANGIEYRLEGSFEEHYGRVLDGTLQIQRDEVFALPLSGAAEGSWTGGSTRVLRLDAGIVLADGTSGDFWIEGELAPASTDGPQPARTYDHFGGTCSFLGVEGFGQLTRL